MVTNELQHISQSIAAVRLSRLEGVGAARFKELIEKYETPKSAFAAIQQGREQLKSGAVDKKKKANSESFLIKAIAMAEAPAPGLGMTYYGAGNYPKRLCAMSEPPPLLFYNGNLKTAKSERSVCIVGARNAGELGRSVAFELALKLAQKKVSIVSGGALGIDAAAHKGALAGGGQTIAVLANGINITYPRTNYKLFMKVVRHGALVTEMFPDTPPIAGHFPARNRIIAGLADAVVFIEGSAASGALITIKHAEKLGLPIFYFSAEKINNFKGGEFIKEKYPGAYKVNTINNLIDMVFDDKPTGK